MNHADILRASASKVNELDSSYGPRELVFDRAARIATILLNIELTPYDVSIITASLHLAHLQSNRVDPDNFISAIVNVAFSGQFAEPRTKADDIVTKGMEDVFKNYTYTTPFPVSDVSSESKI